MIQPQQVPPVPQRVIEHVPIGLPVGTPAMQHPAVFGAPLTYSRPSAAPVAHAHVAAAQNSVGSHAWLAGQCLYVTHKPVHGAASGPGTYEGLTIT